jgi:hypothetical protein
MHHVLVPTQAPLTQDRSSSRHSLTYRESRVGKWPCLFISTMTITVPSLVILHGRASHFFQEDFDNEATSKEDTDHMDNEQ